MSIIQAIKEFFIKEKWNSYSVPQSAYQTAYVNYQQTAQMQNQLANVQYQAQPSIAAQQAVNNTANAINTAVGAANGYGGGQTAASGIGSYTTSISTGLGVLPNYGGLIGSYTISSSLNGVAQTIPPLKSRCDALPAPFEDKYCFRINMVDGEDFTALNELLHGYGPEAYMLAGGIDSRVSIVALDDSLALYLKLKYINNDEF